VRLTAVVLTKNEARNVVPCIESLAWCDEVVVFDSFSDDGTVALAQGAGARCVRHPFRDFAQQRNAALDAVEGDWIFFVDADERATPELGREVRQVIERPDVNGWWVPRHNYVFGRLTRGAGYYPDYQMRLLRAGCGRYERPASEIVVLEGADGHLAQPLIHYNYATVAEFHAKQRARERFEATTLHRQGVRLRWRTYLLQPGREFWRRYVTFRGYRDGWHGVRLCLLLAYYFGWRNYVRLWQMRRSGELDSPPWGTTGS
jgi:glycosyltransferase involved in cell wall biosynthesis